MTVTDEFRAARDQLIELRSDYDAAREAFEGLRVKKCVRNRGFSRIDR